MRSRIIAHFLVLAACLVAPCFGDDEAVAVRQPVEPLTRSLATQILTNSDTIAEGLARQIKSLRNPAEADQIDDIRDVMKASTEWRWYSRDHGILLAIPVKERLEMLSSYNGEKILADVVRRLINQNGWGNPPVKVVLIEPELPQRIPDVVFQATTRYAAVPMCGCNGQ